MSENTKPSGSQARASQQKPATESDKKDSGSQKPQKQDLYGTVPSESHPSAKTRSSKLRKGDADGADSDEAPKKTVSQVAATISTKLTQSDVNRVISSQIQKNTQIQKSDKKDSQDSVNTNKRVGAKEESATPDISMTVSVEVSKASAATVSETVKRGASTKANKGDQSKKVSKSANKKAAGKSTGGPMDLDKLIGVAAKGGSESAEKEIIKSRIEPEPTPSETFSPETNDIEQRDALNTLLKTATDAAIPSRHDREIIKIDDILKRKCHKEKIVANVGVTTSEYDIYFSHKPYEQQKLIARYAITVLEKGRNGIYEAPPGSGKTVAMLSTVVGWLYQRQRAGKHLQTQIIYSVTDLELTGPMILAEIRKLCYKLKVATLDQESLKNSLTGAYKHFTTSPLLEEHYADSHIVLVPADAVLSLGPFLNNNHILVVDEAQRTENWARNTITVRDPSSQIIGFPTNWEKRVAEFVVPDKRKLANHPHLSGAILDSEELIKFLNSVFFEGKSNRERTIKSLGNALLRASNLLDKEAMTLIEENEEAGLTDEIDLLLSWQDLLLTVRELIKDSEAMVISPPKTATRGSGLGSFAQLKNYALHIQPKIGSEGNYSLKLVCLNSALSLNPGKDTTQWAKFYSCLMMSQSIFPVGLYQSILNLQVDLGYQCPRLVSNCMRTFYCPTKFLPDTSVIARMQEVVRLLRTPCILEGTIIVVAQWKDVALLKEASADGVFNPEENGGFKDPKSQMIEEGDILTMTETKKPSTPSTLPLFFDAVESTEHLDAYKQSILSGKGGILVTSYAAPLRPTEKIEFPGRIGRVVIILGTPNIHNLPADPYASLVKKQLDELQKRSPQVIVPDVEKAQERIGAKEWADKIIDRTVSEMMGLGLRDSECHTAIVMLDEKYACNRKKLQLLPKWVLSTLESYQSLESIFVGVTTFLAAPSPLTTQDSAMREIRERLRKPTEVPLHVPHIRDPNYRVRELEEELRQLRMSITNPQWKRRGRKPANYGMGDFEDSLPLVQKSEPRNWREAERGSGIKRGEVEGVMKEFLGKRSPVPEQGSRRVISPAQGSSRRVYYQTSRRDIDNGASHRDIRDTREAKEPRERLLIQDTRNLLREENDRRQERERRGSKSERKRAEESDRRERRERDERKEEKKEERKDDKVKKDLPEPTKNAQDQSVSPAQRQKLKKLFRDEVDEPESRTAEKPKPREILRSSGDRKKQIVRESSDSSSDFEVRGRDKFRPTSKLIAEQDRIQKTTTSSSSRREEGAHASSNKLLSSSRR